MGLQICKERAEQIQGMVRDDLSLAKRRNKKGLSSFPDYLDTIKQVTRIDALTHEIEVARTGRFLMGGGPAVDTKATNKQTLWSQWGEPLEL